MQVIPLTLYIHIPWCLRKCPYCDFNSHTAPQQLPETAYIQALLMDLSQELPLVWGRRLDSIFIGGGTPSLFSPESFETLLGGIRALIPCRPDLEITLEANPGTFEQTKFKAFREVGINRLSVGIQSFSPQQLKALGRVHTAQEALQVADIAHYAGFDNFNLDIMFALPKQTVEQALADLAQAIALQPPHLSWYQLTLEPNTLFYKYPPVLPDEDLSADIQQAGQALIAQQGYRQYEVSAYTRSNQPCRHNINYWQFGDYLGIGAGAHGKISHYNPQTESWVVNRYQKPRQPDTYLQYIAQSQQRTELLETITPEELGFEFMLNALRLKQGFASELFQQRTGLPLTKLTQGLLDAEQKNLLKVGADWIQPTSHGWQFLNNAIELFLPNTG